MLTKSYRLYTFVFRATWPPVWRQVWRGGAKSGGGEAFETGEIDMSRTDARRITIKVVFNQPPLRWVGGEVMRWSERW
jgi:hypothetical protein